MENKYKIVWADNRDKLEEMVNGWITQGWIPTGGVSAVPTARGNIVGGHTHPAFTQAMVKKEVISSHGKIE